MINFYVHLALGTLAFIIVNMIIFPFAYVKTVIVKIKLARKRVITTFNVFEYVLMGLFFLITLQYYDVVNFLTWSLKTDSHHKLKKEIVH